MTRALKSQGQSADEVCNSFEISRNFASAKARVIMVNRKEEQGQEAIDKIKKETNGEAKIEWIPCDLGNLKEVKEVFGGIREREDRLDLVGDSDFRQ